MCLARMHAQSAAARPTPAAPQSFPQISALHIESALLEHPRIAEVAVLGLPDAEYGEVRQLFCLILQLHH